MRCKLAILMPVLLAACEQDEPGITDPPPPPVALAQSDVDLMQQSGPHALELWETSLSMESVALAFVSQASSLNSGQPTTTGALTVSESGSWIYSATPTDRLRIFHPDGSVDLFVSCLRGDVSGSFEKFLFDHECFAYRLVAPDGEIEGSSRGKLIYASGGGVESIDFTTTFSMATEGDERVDGFEAQINANEQSVSFRFGGTIVSSGEEEHFADSWELIAVTNDILRTRVTLGSTLQFGSSSLSLDDVEIDMYTDLANGTPKVSKANEWVATGSVIKNGHRAADVSFERTPQDGNQLPNVGLRQPDGRWWAFDVLGIFGAFNAGSLRHQFPPPASLSMPRLREVLS